MSLKRNVVPVFKSTTLLILVLLSLTLSSCIKESCKTIQCKPSLKFNIVTDGFTVSEIKEVHLRKFVKGSNFTQKISTFIIKNNENTVSIRAVDYNPSLLNIDNSGYAFTIESSFDYEFYVPATNTIRRLSEITDIQEQSTYCRLSLQRGECRNGSIQYCRVDGILTENYIPAFKK